MCTTLLSRIPYVAFLPELSRTNESRSLITLFSPANRYVGFCYFAREPSCDPCGEEEAERRTRFQTGEGEKTTADFTMAEFWKSLYFPCALTFQCLLFLSFFFPLCCSAPHSSCLYYIHTCCKSFSTYNRCSGPYSLWRQRLYGVNIAVLGHNHLLKPKCQHTDVIWLNIDHYTGCCTVVFIIISPWVLVEVWPFLPWKEENNNGITIAGSRKNTFSKKRYVCSLSASTSWSVSRNAIS